MTLSILLGGKGTLMGHKAFRFSYPLDKMVWAFWEGTIRIYGCSRSHLEGPLGILGSERHREGCRGIWAVGQSQQLDVARAFG